MLYRLVRPLLFRMDAEDAHERVTRRMESLQRVPLALPLIRAALGARVSSPARVFGLEFPNPIGIAAGFDKNARLVPMLAALGFGFIEVGTVTLRPQPGNPRPRLFRYPAQGALVNRLGFNNEGAEAVAARLAAFQSRVSLPAPPLFVNIGKNRDTPIEGASAEYAECYRLLAPQAQAVVLNLSSPNTPGLRDLQRPEHLEKIAGSLDKRGPLLIKIAPDLDEGLLAEICDVCVRLADGMICTNTTVERPPGVEESGGVSGAPLRSRSTEVLRQVRRRVGTGYPLIGVGGIFTAEDMQEKFAAGANLVQLYTALVYEGPAIARRLASSLR